jgi:uncharacterized protein (TIGR03437 family)
MRTRIALLLLAAAGSIFAQPTFTGSSVVNAASDQTPLAPGSLATIFGSNLANTTATASTIPLSSSLGGVTVNFVQGSNTYPAPMQFVFSGQINLQVPQEIVPGGAPVSVVVTNGTASAPQQVTVGAVGGGIFSATVGGNNLAVAVNNADGTLAWAAGTVPGSTTHAAKAGDVLIIYATGMGAVDTPIADGTSPSASDNKLRNTLATPTVMVGGVQAQLIYSVLSPQFVGVDQLAITVPSGVTPGNTVPLQIVANGVTSPSTTVIAITQ